MTVYRVYETVKHTCIWSIHSYCAIDFSLLIQTLYFRNSWVACTHAHSSIVSSAKIQTKRNGKLIKLNIAVFSGHNNQKYTTQERKRDGKMPGGNENKYNIICFNYKSPIRNNIVREEVFWKSVHRNDVNNGNNSSKQWKTTSTCNGMEIMCMRMVNHFERWVR